MNRTISLLQTISELEYALHEARHLILIAEEENVKLDVTRTDAASIYPAIYASFPTRQDDFMHGDLIVHHEKTTDPWSCRLSLRILASDSSHVFISLQRDYSETEYGTQTISLNSIHAQVIRHLKDKLGIPAEAKDDRIQSFKGTNARAYLVKDPKQYDELARRIFRIYQLRQSDFLLKVA